MKPCPDDMRGEHHFYEDKTCSCGATIMDRGFTWGEPAYQTAGENLAALREWIGKDGRHMVSGTLTAAQFNAAIRKTEDAIRDLDLSTVASQLAASPLPEVERLRGLIRDVVAEGTDEPCHFCGAVQIGEHPAHNPECLWPTLVAEAEK
jgi:hypothetical protein